MKPIYLYIILIVLLLLSTTLPVLADNNPCGPDPNCVYASAIYNCTNPGYAPPHQNNLWVLMWDRDTNRVSEYRLILETASPEDAVYSVLVVGLNTNHRYQARFRESGEYLSNWSEEFRPPNTVGTVVRRHCENKVLVPIVGK